MTVCLSYSSVSLLLSSFPPFMLSSWLTHCHTRIIILYVQVICKIRISPTPPFHLSRQVGSTLQVLRQVTLWAVSLWWTQTVSTWCHTTLCCSISNCVAVTTTGDELLHLSSAWWVFLLPEDQLPFTLYLTFPKITRLTQGNTNEVKLEA